MIIKGKVGQIKDKAKKYLDSLQPATDITIEINETKSVPQNKKIHKLIRLIANKTKEDVRSIKAYLKVKHGFYEKVIVGEKEYPVPLSLADFTKEELTHFIQLVEMDLIEFGINNYYEES